MKRIISAARSPVQQRTLYMILFAVAIMSLLVAASSMAWVSAETIQPTGPIAQPTFFPTPTLPPIAYDFNTFLPVTER